MKVINTKIPDVKLLEPQVFGDDVVSLWKPFVMNGLNKT